MSQHDDFEVEREERGIYAIVTVASAPVVIGLAIEGGVFDGGSTLSLILVFLGLLGLMASLRVFLPRKIPRAAVHREL